MREKIVWHIDKEIEEAKAGRKAEMIIKVNSLSDKGLIKNFMKQRKLAWKLK